MRTGHPRPWRRGSEYVDPPRNTLDRGQRHCWRRRVVAEARAGNLPGKAILTAEALIGCIGEGGELYPSHQAIASKAGVGLRTVARHLARMAELGLLTRIRRLVRRPWPEGGRGAVRVEQTSNAYVLLFPLASVGERRTVGLSSTVGRATMGISPMVARSPNTGCHSGPVEAGRRIPSVPAGDRTAALAALEAVRVAREAAAAARWWAARG